MVAVLSDALATVQLPISATGIFGNGAEFVVLLRVAAPHPTHPTELAGATGIEPATYGFGDRRSTS